MDPPLRADHPRHQPAAHPSRDPWAFDRRGHEHVEVIRAGIQTVAPGQIEAAQASGFSHVRTMRHIVLPQALRLTMPPFVDSHVSLLKATALVAIIAVPDLMFTAQRMAADTYRPIELLTTAAILHFVIAYPMVPEVRVLERRVRLVPLR